MSASALGVGAVRVAAAGATLVGRTMFSRRQRERIATEAAQVMAAGDTERFLEELTVPQIERLQTFANSAAFEHLVRQAMILVVGGAAEESRSALHEQLRHALKHGGQFTGADLVQATDVLEALAYESVHAVRQSASPDSLDSGRAVVAAAAVAAAAARTSELLAKVESIGEIERFAKAVRAAGKTGFAKMRVAVHAMNRQVDYAKLYVTPTLGSARGFVSPAWLGTERLALAGTVRDVLRFAVLGDPGAGKSTLARKLAHDIAADAVPGLEGQVPILLIVRDHTQSLRAEHETLLRYLEAACRRPGNTEPPAEALEYLLLHGRVTVIIDGVDELGDSAFRQSFAELVDGFARLYPMTRIVVTSRVVGYRDAPLDADLFPVAGIEPFTDAQVAQYVNRWFRLDESRDTGQRQQLTESFMRESAAAPDLRTNPLVLSLLCGLYASVHYIPRNRPEIYERCAELLFETWDRSRGIETPHRFAAHIRPAVQRLAWRLLTDSQGRQALPRAELETFLAEYMGQRRFDDPDEAAQAARDFLDFCAGRAWVLTDVGSDALQPRYGFAHRTFLEFFAAAQLVKAKPEPAAVWSQIEPRLDDSSWAVVAQLAVQILDRNCDDGADHLLTLALDRARNHVDAARYLRFGASCLDTVAPGNDTIRDLARQTVAQACAIPWVHRRGFSGAPASHLSSDEPLILMLATTAPDNVDRVARALAAELHRFAEKAPDHTSAGLLYDVFRRDIRNGVDAGPLSGQVAASLDGNPVPATAQHWERLRTRPTGEDLRSHGLVLLHHSTWMGAGGPVLNPTIADILTDLLHDGQTWIDALEHCYPAVIANRSTLHPIAVEVRRVQSPWHKDINRLPDTTLAKMSLVARSTLVLLLMPIITSAADDTSRNINRFGEFKNAVLGSYPHAAVDVINSWALTPEAHDYLIESVSQNA